MTTSPTTSHDPLPAYPVRLQIEYPERALDRASTFLRLIYAIPILVVIGLLVGSGSADSDTSQRIVIASSGFVTAPLLLMLLFRQRYPRWWFDWNLELQRFSLRVCAYMALLDDHYPSTVDAQSVRFDMDYPDAERDLSRWLPLFKWLLAIPHYVVLFVLSVLSLLAVIGAWFTILFTGRYPRGLFDFVVGTMRYSARVSGYAVLLVTDQYPPFRLAP